MSSPEKSEYDEGQTAAFRPISIARLREWVAMAKPGARIVYGHGRHLAEACPAQVGEWMREVLQQRGFVALHQQRASGKFDYLAIRTAKPFPKGIEL